MDKTKAWEVSPDGTFNAISIEEAKKYGETVGYDTEFIFFSKEGKKGIVLTLNENTLKNPALFEKYAHIGTYDLFITYVHELFHNEEQTKRYTPPLSFPTDRDELLKDYEARAARAVILQQLLSAFSSPQTELSFLKKAVATYRAYQKAFPQDAAITQYWDTIEGAAYYVELISSLKV
ncbi:MAG: hypothetical protein LBD75_05845 [Candidatus Peribacteria bacterium]|jgi:hypothetical protein|nr:hypothetical protein [Candidatus Peribacteria bacterium]